MSEEELRAQKSKKLWDKLFGQNIVCPKCRKLVGTSDNLVLDYKRENTIVPPENIEKFTVNVECPHCSIVFYASWRRKFGWNTSEQM